MANGSQASVRLSGRSASSSHPAAPPAELVARAVDDQAAGRQLVSASSTMHRPPLDRILAQHVERSHQNRAPPGQFETAEREFDRRRRRCARDPVRMDLQADDPNVGAHHPQPRGEFQGRDRQRAVAEVDHQRVGGGLQRGAHPPRMHQPTVAASQPVVAGGTPRELSNGGGHECNFRPGGAPNSAPRRRAGAEGETVVAFSSSPIARYVLVSGS